MPQPSRTEHDDQVVTSAEWWPDDVDLVLGNGSRELHRMAGGVTLRSLTLAETFRGNLPHHRRLRCPPPPPRTPCEEAHGWRQVSEERRGRWGRSDLLEGILLRDREESLDKT